MVTRNTSCPRHPRLWRNASSTDLWYDAVHSLLTRSLRSPRLGTSSGYPLDGRVSPTDPPCLRPRPIPPDITRGTLTANGFPCRVNRVSSSTRSLPWMKARSMPPASPTHGSPCPDGDRQLRTQYSRTAPWRSVVLGSKRHRWVNCGVVACRGIFSSLNEYWHGTGIGIRSIQPQQFPRIEGISTAT